MFELLIQPFFLILNILIIFKIMSLIRNFRSSPTRARNPTEFSDTRRPPQPWVVRYSERANPGIPYYFNTRTFKSQWEFPEDEYIELSQYTHPPPPPPAPALSISKLSMPNQPPNQPPNPLLSQPSTTIPEVCNGGLCPNMTTTQSNMTTPLPSMEEVIERLSSEPPGAILREIRRRRFSNNEINIVNRITRFLSYLEAFDKTKHMIQQKFPNLDQYIIDDAFKDAIFAFTNNPLVSEEDANSEFFKVMMNSINERKIQPGTLTTLMLLRERNDRTKTPLRSNKAQDFTSAFMKLPSRPLEMIAEKLAEQANKFNHNDLRFPRLSKKVEKVDDRIPLYIMFTKDPNRLNKYFYLNDKLREQLIYIERLLSIEPFTYPYHIPGHSELNYNEKQNVQVQIFEEFYRLTKLNLNANELERLIIESVITIIKNSSMSSEQMRQFMLNFANTINNQDNYTYCQKVVEDFK
jgi:hypothetical protein